MSLRTQAQIAFTLLAATGATLWAAQGPAHAWLPFFMLLAGVFLSSGLKVTLPSGDGSMSATFPFILLGLLELSPFQAMLLAAASVAAQCCRKPVRTLIVAVQASFNIASAVVTTAVAFSICSFLRGLHVGSAPALAVASVAYFLWSTGNVAAVVASSKGQKTWQLWREEFPWYLPFYLVGAGIAALAHYLAAHFGWATALLLIPAVYTLYRAYMGQLTQLKERQQHLEETEALHLRTIEGLAMAIEAKDQGTHDHLFRVRNYVQSVGEALALDKVEMKALQTASFLHDIGKLAVPEHIINKPGKLTPEEFEKIKIHPGVGADILERVRFPYPVVPIVRSHHEWWNGTGYPDGLKGEEIPVGARVLTIVDCFDALVSDRPYRKGMTSQQALSLIRNLAGKQFDPVIVDIFEQCHAAAELHSASLVESAFTPLNTQLAISRGVAPGAGFEAGAGEETTRRTRSASGSETVGSSPVIVSESPALLAAVEKAQALYELSDSLGTLFTSSEFASLTLASLLRLIPADTCAVFHRQDASIRAHFVEGEYAGQFSRKTISVGEGISGWVAQSGKPILNGNATMEPGCPAYANGSLIFRSALSIPLVDAQQEVFAVLTFYAAKGDAFQRDHLRMLQAMEGRLSPALHRSLDCKQTNVDDEKETATGLLTAKDLFLALEAELQVCRDAKVPLAVVSFDLNAFKEINDRRGSVTGDRVLREVAESLGRTAATRDIVGRVGGDEFLLVLPGIAEPLIKHRTDALRTVVTTAARRVLRQTEMTISLGVAIFPADGDTAEDLLALADRRMYLEKQQFYSTNTSVSVDPRTAVTA